MKYKNILLVDDDIEDASIFIEAINALDKSILCRSETNPITALENLQSSEELPDLIFLDYNMPVINGNEFIDKMRTVEKLKSIRVILYSSYSESAAEQLSIIHDTETYICKPNTFNELLRVLKNILEV